MSSPPIVAVALLLAAGVCAGCGDDGRGAGTTTGGKTTATAPSSPGVRSAEHDAREGQAEGERVYTEPDGQPVAPEPQDPEPNHGTPGAQDATGGKVDVPIRDGRFTQPHMRVGVGQIVVFTDDDDVPHTVRNVRGGLPHSGLIPVGGRFEFTALKPGRVRYHCIIHPRMRGELIVVSRLRQTAPPGKPKCSELSRSARHELGDTISEMSTHCVRDP